MKEELITFETAKLAKEKGFDELSSRKYDINSKEILEVSYWEGNGDVTTIAVKNENIEDDEVLAPTQSLLQKWLREEYNIQLCLQPLYGGDKIEGRQIGWLCYTPYNDEEFNNLPSISLSEYTYEEALEEGLQEALKLI